jgi:DNA invertase Pin-like site-specific DNA recombinase
VKVIGYVRVSDVDGRNGERFISPDVQRETITRFVGGKRHELVDVVVELDESGGRLDRPGLEAVLRRLEAGEADAICVAYLSRLSRRVLDGLQVVQRLSATGRDVLIADLDLDTSTPIGRAVLTVMLAFAELELEQRRDGWAVAQRRALDRGVYPGSTPLGYLRDESGRMIPNPATAPTIRRLFEERAAGASWAALARMLDEEMPRADRTGWRASTVRSMTHTPLYIGRLEHTVGRELVVVEDAHEPIVDRALWEAVSANGSAARAPTRRAEPALLAGLVRCAGCGGPMSRGSGGRKRNAAGHVVAYDAYVCLARCERNAKISVPALDRYVLGEVLARLGESAAVDASGCRTDEVTERRSRLAEAERELGAYLEAVSAADVGEAAFAHGARSRRERVDEARRALAAAELQARRVGRSHRELIEWLPDASDGEANPVLRTLIGEVQVRKSGTPGRGGSVAGRVRIAWPVDDALEDALAVGKHVGRKRQRSGVQV